jgi:hypothetical protein
MLRWIVNFVVMSTLRVVQNRAVGHITVVELKLNYGDLTDFGPPDFGQHLKWTLSQNSRSKITYVIPVTVNCSYFTPDERRGECPKHVE